MFRFATQVRFYRFSFETKAVPSPLKNFR